MRTLTESINLIAEKSARTKFNSYMGGEMLPRGLNFTAIAVALTAVYPEATHDSVLNEFLPLEDEHFEALRQEHYKQFEKDNA